MVGRVIMSRLVSISATYRLVSQNPSEWAGLIVWRPTIADHNSRVASAEMSEAGAIPAGAGIHKLAANCFGFLAEG
jgi:hypothetical protein